MEDTLYHVEGRDNLPPFNAFNAKLSVRVSELLAAEDAEAVIAVAGAQAVADMQSMWNQYKHRIIAVEGN